MVKKLLYIGLILSMLFLIGCGKSDRIEGKVQDVFGNPLPGVTISIKNSAFETKTDESGEYSLDYAPGDIKLTYSKPGFTTRDLTLNIQQKVHYPAKTMTLYPVPKEKGIYYVDLDKKRLIKLKQNAKLNEKEIKKASGGMYEHRIYNMYLQTFGKTPIFKEGKAIFIDKLPNWIDPAKIRNDGLFYTVDHKQSLFQVQFSVTYSGVIEEKIKRFDKEEISVRELNLNSGLYAWVELEKTDFGILDNKITVPVERNGVFFAFRVEKANSTIQKEVKKK